MRAPLCSRDPAELLKPEVIEEPHAFLARLRAEHPVSRVAETGVHLVASWDAVVEALQESEGFSANLTGVLMRDAQGQPTVLGFPVTDATQVIATADEPAHGVHRQLVLPRLVKPRVAAMEPRVRRWAREAVASFLASGGGDFVPLAERLPARVIGHLLGLPEGDAERHRAWAMMGGDMLAGNIDEAGMQALASETGAMAAYLQEHLEKAQARAPYPAEESLLEALAQGVHDGAVTLSQATGIAIVMFGAGGESTSALLGSSVRLLCEDPALAQRLRERPSEIPRFVEEVLRLEPPFKFHYRAVKRPCKLRGYSLQPGDRLMLLWAAANRDPAVFASPDTLRLDRPHPKHHMAFGRGAHFCLGSHLARLEARVVVEEILGASKRLALVSGSPPVHAPSIFTRRLERLVVSAEAAA